MIALDIGCGPTTKAGHIGLDIVAAPNVAHVLDFCVDPLPFEDNSVDAIFSSHCWEHIEHPKLLLGEILRVCKPEAKVELWMPYGHSDDAFILGHRIFYTELHWQHFVVDYPHDWTPGATKHYRWDETRYDLAIGAPERVKAFDVPLRVAIKSLVNVAWEFGLFFTVKRGAPGSARYTPAVETFVQGREGVPIQ